MPVSKMKEAEIPPQDIEKVKEIVSKATQISVSFEEMFKAYLELDDGLTEKNLVDEILELN
ncbi:MAG: hypothetical protein COU69_01090 [Candidatus Pacebacteria bacterium CG10_big_fil_rev_8_21_14_0_10_56_10]|nr:MAG: hypothetical protein COU69_01090 [Candidatus Pacebacteria bacterium CG10_big_fil_rev_8_21_14_0_10_56_10]